MSELPPNCYYKFDRTIKRDDSVYSINSGGFLVCPPFNASNNVPNNKWMVDAAVKDEAAAKIDPKKAVNQWLELYETLSNGSMVYILPNRPGLQDQVYTANLGIVLPHLDDPTVIISNYKSEPRRAEAQVGIDFFKMMDYDVYQAPHFFEGEADLKYVKDNVYIGGYGIRSASKNFDWMRDQFGMNVIPLRMRDEYLYHLDCNIFPMNVDTIMACTEIIDADTIKEIEKHVDIVDVDLDLAYQGINNSVRAYGTILQASNLEDLKLTDEYYGEEKRKVETLTKICQKHGFEPLFINISELYKSGAMLSCCVMNLNFRDFEFSNV